MITLKYFLENLLVENLIYGKSRQISNISKVWIKSTDLSNIPLSLPIFIKKMILLDH